MKIGKVVTALEVSKRAPCLGDRPLLLVRTPTEELVAADLVGAAPGEAVLLLTGPAAAGLAMDAPADAAAVAVVDGNEYDFP